MIDCILLRYARPSRRQSAKPDIPRPRVQPLDDGTIRTFAVLLGTSGSIMVGAIRYASGGITRC